MKKTSHKQKVYWLNALLLLFLFFVAQFAYSKANQIFTKVFYSKSESSAFVQYQFDKIVFVYPANWNLKLTPYGNHGDTSVVAILNIPFQSSPEITIYKQEIGENDVYKVVEWKSAKDNTKLGYESSSLQKFESNNLPSLILVYSYRIETPITTYTIKCKDVFMNPDKDGFVFSFCSEVGEWDSYKSVFDEIISKIKLID